MIRERIKALRSICLWIMSLLIAIFVYGTYFHVPILNLMFFASMQVFGVFAPGLCMLDMFNIKFKDKLSLYFSSYAVGYCVSIVIFTISLLLGYVTILYILFYGIAFISLLYLICKFFKSTIEISKKSIEYNIPIYLILCVVLISGFFVGPFFSRSPEFIGYQHIYADNMYWYKQCVASTMSFPIPDLSFAGLTTYWHMFSCFEVAMMHMITGIEIYDLCFSLSYVWQVFLMLGSTYVILNELLSNRVLVYLGCLIALLCSGDEPETFVYLLCHLYSARLGCPEGYAMTMYALLFISKIDNKCYYLIGLLFFVCALGAKAPYGAIIMIFLVVTLLLNLIENKISFCKAFACGIPYLLLFVMIMNLFVVGDTLGAERSNQQMLVSLATIKRTPLGMMMTELLLPTFGKSMTYMLILPVYLIMSNFIIFPLFIISMFGIKKILQHKNFVCASIVTSIVGICIFIFMNHNGFSQVYFMFISLPILLVSSLAIIDQFKKEYYKPTIIILGVFTICTLAFTIVKSPDFFSDRGKHRVRDIVCSEDGESITRTELEALRWVRDNVGNDKIIATNKSMGKKGKRSFVTSCFTEKQIFVEGTDYSTAKSLEEIRKREQINMLYFQGETFARLNLKNNGVKYSILYKGISSPIDILGDVIYENDAMVIYEL